MGRTQEHRAAIELLGQALQAQDQTEPGDDLARRLIPAKPARKCEAQLMGLACCAGEHPFEDDVAYMASAAQRGAPVGRIPTLNLGPAKAAGSIHGPSSRMLPF